MIYMQLEILDGADDKAKRLVPALDKAIKDAIAGWHANILPGHFKHGAKSKYRYDARSPGYYRRKQKKGLPDLVYSGEARRKLKRKSFFRVSGSRGRLAGRFIVGNDLKHLWVQPHRTKRRYAPINLAKEITATNEAERRAMIQFIQVQTAKYLNETRARRKRVIR